MQELTFTANVMVDDGNLPCALGISSLDILHQLDNLIKSEGLTHYKSLLKQPLFFVTMIFQSAYGQIVVDPTYEEMHISNNLMTITALGNGK